MWSSTFQRSVTLDLYIPRSTEYVLFTQYHSPASIRQQTADVLVDQRGRNAVQGKLNLPACPYRYSNSFFVQNSFRSKCILM